MMLAGAASLVLLAGCFSTPSDDPLFLRPQVAEVTPQCREHPNAPVVGRVVGWMQDHPPRSVSFVGCFPSLAECNAWRAPVSSLVTGRLRYNECTPR